MRYGGDNYSNQPPYEGMNYGADPYNHDPSYRGMNQEENN
eukprot:CAMPEP_0170560086 /NCGR_PEP_ID=MMETSP0211-20121228/46955_1 /TAXON_ID=311385 /ORGANISM="Pseudokeronopsis sp., Strain OXSARD2" /LENGTH=39 /DNA_ID= /DNA_START= /DNA_END= /DNA_ORIENTATION=